MKAGLIVAAILISLATALIIQVTRDGELVIPEGADVITVGTDQFASFPLPEYVTNQLNTEYKSYFVEVEPGIKIHVLEIGTGYPVLLQHGNPTTGLLYRKVVEALPIDKMRVILPTLVGLGFSSKVPASQHTLANHIRWYGNLLDQLHLSEFIYAGQDWGGPIAMGAFAKSPGRLQGMVVLNTFFNAVTEPGDLSPGHRIAKRPIIGELIFELIISLFKNLPKTQGDPASLPPETLALYAIPVEESDNAKAPLGMMRMVPDGPKHPTTEHMQVIEQYVQNLEIPIEIVWGSKDPILASHLPAMRKNFPNAPITVTEAGHFLQEEVPNEIASALERILKQVQASLQDQRQAQEQTQIQGTPWDAG